MAVNEGELDEGRTGTFWVFRVNRRPARQPSLLDVPWPNVFQHFGTTLVPGHAVVTGRRSQREWRIGRVTRLEADRILVGKVGWRPLGEVEEVPEWSEEDLDWVSTTTSRRGEVVPFAFDGETRLLVVEQLGRTAAHTIAAVFERVLRENEGQGDEELAGAIEWSVEPVLDGDDFRSWLRSMDTVTLVSFTAKLPNPEPMDAFEDLAARMEARHATALTETLRSERDEGLVGIEDDRDVHQAIAMGEQGFATLRGEGRVDGERATYQQDRRVARARVRLPRSWDDLWPALKDLLRGPARRFLEEDDEAR